MSLLGTLEVLEVVDVLGILEIQAGILEGILEDPAGILLGILDHAAGIFLGVLEDTVDFYCQCKIFSVFLHFPNIPWSTLKALLCLHTSCLAKDIPLTYKQLWVIQSKFRIQCLSPTVYLGQWHCFALIIVKLHCFFPYIAVRANLAMII